MSQNPRALYCCQCGNCTIKRRCRRCAHEICTQCTLRKPSNTALPKRESSRRLSARELEIMRLFVAGARIYQIAIDLGLSIKTVSTHKCRAAEKLCIDTKSDVAIANAARLYIDSLADPLSRPPDGDSAPASPAADVLTSPSSTEGGASATAAPAFFGER